MDSFYNSLAMSYPATTIFLFQKRTNVLSGTEKGFSFNDDIIDRNILKSKCVKIILTGNSITHYGECLIENSVLEKSQICNQSC